MNLLSTKVLFRDTGLAVQGLFRISASKLVLNEAKRRYDIGVFVDLRALGGPHVAGDLIKQWFRELPRPIIAENDYALIAEICIYA